MAQVKETHTKPHPPFSELDKDKAEKDEKMEEKEAEISERWKKQNELLDALKNKVESIPEKDFTIVFCGLASVGKSSIIKLLLENTENPQLIEIAQNIIVSSIPGSTDCPT